MNEAQMIERQAYVQFFVREMHEYEIAGLQAGARNGYAGLQLLRGRARHTNARRRGAVEHQAAAVESAWGSTAEAIGPAEHGDRVVHHQCARIGRDGRLRSG